MAGTYPSKDTCLDSSWIIKDHLRYFTIMLPEITIYTCRNSYTTSYWTDIYSLHVNMDPVDYWPMAREYSAWNAAVAALQFWTDDLEAHLLSSAIEQVYNALFYSTSTYLLHQWSDEILFSHFVTTLNATFKSKLALEGECYESGNKNFNIPTPPRRTSKIHPISSTENVSFDPNPITPCSTGTKEPHCRLVCWCLTFISSEEDDDDTPNRWVSISYQSAAHTVSHRYPLVIIINVHLKHKCYPRSRSRRRRGLPNSAPRWWTLGYGRNPWQIFMFTWTFLATWTMPLPMSIFGLPYNIILQYIGFKWHLWVWRSDDHIQWWRHPCTWWYWILNRLWLEMNIYIHMNSRTLDV